MNLRQANIVELVPLVSGRTATLTTSAIDLRKYEGVGQVILQCEAASAGTNPTMAVKVTECATSGGSYTDVTGGAFTTVTDAADSTQMLAIDLAACKGFVKIVGTIGGTSSPAFTYGVTMVACNKAGRNSSQSV